MPGKVADASVVAALVFRESKREEAAEILGGDDLHAPSLLAYELTNVARKKHELYPDQAEAAIEGLDLGLNLVTHWVDVDYQSVLRIALETGISAYDAAYLWVARNSGLPLVTFDEELQRASRSLNQ